MEVFVKAAAAGQTSGGGRVSDGFNSWRPNSDGCRAELSLGTLWRLDASNQINLSYQAAFGSRYTQPWGVNLGYNYKF